MSQVFVKTLYHRLVLAGYSPRQSAELITKLIELTAEQKHVPLKVIMNEWFDQLPGPSS